MRVTQSKQQVAINWASVRAAITEPRFGPYLAAVSGVETDALAAYHHNLRVSGAVYEDLAIVEVALRNAMDSQLRVWNATQTDATGRHLSGEWLLDPARLLRRLLRDDLVKAQNRAQIRKGRQPAGSPARPPSHDDLLTGLTLGTWRYLLPDNNAGKQYLWQAALRRAFPHLTGGPVRLVDAINGIWFLRNRVAHLEPLTKPSALRRQIRNMRLIMRCIDPDLETWLVASSRLVDVLATPDALP